MMLNFFETYPVALIGLCALVGLGIGSFLNVLVYRLPLMMRHASGLSLWLPRSHCPQCKHVLSFMDNLPLLSYYLLKARCRYCQNSISKGYVFVEAAATLCSATLAWRFGATLPLVGALCLSFALIALAAIDINHFLLPDSITLPLLWSGLAFNLIEVFVPLSAAVFGAMLGYLLLWSAFHLFKLVTGKEGMGYGDFKLLAAGGAWLGYHALPIILMLSASLAIFVRLILFRHKKNSYFAFGPYLCFALLIVLFWR